VSKRGKSKRLPTINQISVEVEGQTFSGTYYVEGDPPIVTVNSPYGSHSTQKGNSPAETIAGMMLGQMVRSWRQPGRVREDLRKNDSDPGPE
jgi:hypothetical protein